jgi:YD repeat-containing protein
MSTFATGQSGTNAWIEMTDPLGGKERIEFLDNAPGINGSETTAPSTSGITNSGLNVANSFYWDKKTIHDYPPVGGVYDYTKAHITHWTYNSDGTLSGVAGSEKAPLESRVWYTYLGQTDSNHAGAIGSPSQVARVLDDGTTQLSQYTYNTLGKLTQSVDPITRTFAYAYDTNNIDLLTIRQTKTNNELLRTLTYNSFHEPLTDKDAAGEITTYGYNAYGQLQTVQNAKNETTTYAYGDGTTVPIGYLASITSPTVNGAAAVTSFTYDSANRVRTVTNNPDGYTLTTDYDNLDRPTQVTYPDTTTKQFHYTQDFGSGLTTILDLTGSKDRRGQWTTRHYDANRHMDSITDPLNRSTLYGWCNCGALLSITDANAHTTTFNRDIESRVTSKVFHDTKSIAYTYENNTSRLKSMTDAKSQVTNYQYFSDNDLKQISYTNAQIATPTVNFTYDPCYNRVSTMVDGTGTTTYAYNAITGSVSIGAGQLYSVDGALANDTIIYSYDELGRELSRAINGTSATQTYDALGRYAGGVNPLGTFATPTYDGPTARVSSIALPNGQSTTYSYFATSGDKRLQTILNSFGSTLLSRFDYSYDADGEIWYLSKQFGPGQQNLYGWGGNDGVMNDAADQLKWFGESQGGGFGNLFQFSYDNAGNQLVNLHGTFSPSTRSTRLPTPVTYMTTTAISLRTCRARMSGTLRIG